jgi:[ribosomal protein S5]-alanine N-acetyltransferase
MIPLNFTPFPELVTNRLLLRQLHSSDALSIAHLRSNEIVNKYLSRPKTSTLTQAQLFINKINKSIRNNEAIYWVITLKNSDALIGTICIWNIEPKEESAEIGYEMLPQYYKQGIMNEALQAVINFVYETMQLRVIIAFTITDNLASVQLLERNSFKPDYTFKNEDYTINEVKYYRTK